MTGFFSGSLEAKARPAVIISSDVYHNNRPDVVICFLTSQVAGATAPTDYALHNWKEAGLKQPSAFRAFYVTVRANEVTNVGRLSDEDWSEIKERLKLAIEI